VLNVEREEMNRQSRFNVKTAVLAEEPRDVEKEAFIDKNQDQEEREVGRRRSQSVGGKHQHLFVSFVTGLKNSNDQEEQQEQEQEQEQEDNLDVGDAVEEGVDVNALMIQHLNEQVASLMDSIDHLEGAQSSEP